jgi:hypothetical protein
MFDDPILNLPSGKMLTPSTGKYLNLKGPWSPHELAPEFWFRADDTSSITESGGKVSAWGDHSGNGRDLTEGTASQQPFYDATGFNGMPCVKFRRYNSSKGWHMGRNIGLDGVATGDHMIFLVTNDQSEITGDRWFGTMYNDSDGLGTFKEDRLVTGNATSWQSDASNGKATATSEANKATAQITCMQLSDLTPKYFFNGDDVSNTTVTGYQNNGWRDNSTQSFVLNGRNSGDGHAGAEHNLAEWVMVMGTDEDDRQKMEGYLAHKWGITELLPYSHPYKYRTPQSSIPIDLWTPADITTEAWYDAEDTTTITTTQLGQFDVVDFSANNGINPATGLRWRTGDTYRLAFISSTTITATSSNIADYNTLVQNAANAAGLGAATWKAFVSTATVDAKDNCSMNVGDPEIAIYRMDGTLCEFDNVALFDGWVRGKIVRNENNALNPNLPVTVPFFNYIPVWTGCGTYGDPENPVGGATVNFGICEAENQFQFDRGGSSSTSEEMYLIAFSEPLTVDLEGPVSAWADKSGNGNDATQGTVLNQPEVQPTGWDGSRQALYFDGVNDNLVYDSTITFTSDSATAFYVFKPDGVNDFQLGTLNSRNGWTIDASGATIEDHFRTVRINNGNILSQTDPNLYMVEADGTAPLYNLYNNGSSVFTNTASFTFENNNVGQINNAPTRAFKGWFAEIIYIDGVLSESDRQKVEGYLAWKWGLTANLPITHPYKTQPPAA